MILRCLHFPIQRSVITPFISTIVNTPSNFFGHPLLYPHPPYFLKIQTSLAARDGPMWGMHVSAVFALISRLSLGKLTFNTISYGGRAAFPARQAVMCCQGQHLQPEQAQYPGVQGFWKTL